MRSKSPEWVENLQKMLNKLEYIKKLPSSEKGLHLHLGCGPQILDGFVNIDKYHKDPIVLQCDMYKLPFSEGTVDTIYSSHALEHLPIRHANTTLRNWSKVLRKNGYLYLAVPDLEEIMSIMLDENVDDNSKWNWYVYTLFGYQIRPGEFTSDSDTKAIIDQGQFHTTGFTKKRITFLLEREGFKVTEIFNYDGWSTPSIWVEARKE
jgi:SAM-dependent methyltransferase